MARKLPSAWIVPADSPARHHGDRVPLRSWFVVDAERLSFPVCVVECACMLN